MITDKYWGGINKIVFRLMGFVWWVLPIADKRRPFRAFHFSLFYGCITNFRFTRDRFSLRSKCALWKDFLGPLSIYQLSSIHYHLKKNARIFATRRRDSYVRTRRTSATNRTQSKSNRTWSADCYFTCTFCGGRVCIQYFGRTVALCYRKLGHSSNAHYIQWIARFVVRQPSHLCSQRNAAYDYCYANQSNGNVKKCCKALIFNVLELTGWF